MRPVNFPSGQITLASFTLEAILSDLLPSWRPRNRRRCPTLTASGRPPLRRHPRACHGDDGAGSTPLDSFNVGRRLNQATGAHGIHLKLANHDPDKAARLYGGPRGVVRRRHSRADPFNRTMEVIRAMFGLPGSCGCGVAGNPARCSRAIEILLGDEPEVAGSLVCHRCARPRYQCG